MNFISDNVSHITFLLKNRVIFIFTVIIYMNISDFQAWFIKNRICLFSPITNKLRTAHLYQGTNEQKSTAIYLLLGKLRYFSWSECRDSNSRPLEPHSSAIPNFATPGYSLAPEISLIRIPQVFRFCNPFFEIFSFYSIFFLLTKVGGYGKILPAFGISPGFYIRRDGWVVESTGLENRRCESIRGFESHSLRQSYINCRLYAEVPKWPKGLPC